MFLNSSLWLFLLLPVWIRSDALVINAENLLQSLLRPWAPTQQEKSDEPPALAEVKHLTTASYKGINYVMVKNISLGFAEAERYCENEFSDAMHLVSVSDEDEWRMLANVFGTSYPSELWLGGTVRRTSPQVFILHWLDTMSFVYHRFPPSERRRWMENWRVNSHGCIVGNLESSAQGNWTAELTPCTEARAFICKEAVKPSSPPMGITPNDGLKNLLISLLFPSPSIIPYTMDYIRSGRKPQQTTEAYLPDTTQTSTEALTTDTTERLPIEPLEQGVTDNVSSTTGQVPEEAKEQNLMETDGITLTTETLSTEATEQSSITSEKAQQRESVTEESEEGKVPVRTKLLRQHDAPKEEPSPSVTLPGLLPKFTIFPVGNGVNAILRQIDSHVKPIYSTGDGEQSA